MSAEQASEYQLEQTSKVEPWLLKNLCEPLVVRIPAWIAPNAITYLNALVMFTMFGLAAVSPRLSGASRLAVILGGAAAMFTAMILDSLDGMHARRTKQTSKRGEFLDHWLDAIHIPLVSGTVALMLDVNPLILGLTMVLGSSIYNAQLCLYYRSGKFVSPPTSGMEAQVIGTGVLTLTGLMFYFSNRYTPAVAWTIWAICVAAVWAQGRQWWFFFDRLGRRPGGIFTFTLQVAALFGLYYWNGLGRLTFIVAVVFLSFRSSGTYVLRTLAKKPYDGHDIVSWAFIALAWAGFLWAPDVSLLGQSLTVLAVAAGAAVQIARNVVEVVRDRAALTPPAGA